MKQQLIQSVKIGSLTLLLLACGSNKSDEAPVESVQSDQLEVGTPFQTSVINASDQEKWVYIDLDQGFQETTADLGWDIAIQRFKIKLNPDNATVGAVYLEANLTEIEIAPADGYRQDLVTEKPEDGFVFGGEDPWYDYNPQSHALSPKQRIYVVRSGDNEFYALHIANYYDAAGSPAVLTFEWKTLASSTEQKQLTDNLGGQ